MKQFLGYVVMFVVWYSTLLIFTSGYDYALVDGQVKRAWMIKLPGYEPYIDLNKDPPVLRYVFSVRANYRVSPWFDPENTDNTPLPQ